LLLDKGLTGEYVAILFYILKLYIPIGHRVKSKCGEIDIVLQKRRLLIFSEVKYRSSKFDSVVLKHGQQRRIKKAAELFIMRNAKYQDFECRFDLVIVPKYFLFPEIIKDAF
jgi:putative endonuclease